MLALFSLDFASYLATASLWSGAMLAWLAARNNGGVRQIRAMLFLVASMAMISTLANLRHLGLIAISPLLLTRMFNAVLILTGVTLTAVFGLKYAKAKRLKRIGLAETNIKIKVPIRGREQCNGQTS